MTVTITSQAEKTAPNTVQIFVCGKCKPKAGEENTNPTPGPTLYHALKAHLASQESSFPATRLKQAGCHSVCTRPATLTIATSGKMSWVFADLTANQLADLSQFIQTFAASPHGQIPKTERPPALQARLVVKLPPVAA